MCKDCRTILRSHIRALHIECGGVVGLPEDCEELFVGNLCGIKRHLDDFRVTRLIGADVLVGRVSHRPTHIPYLRIDDAQSRSESLLYSPEAAGSEGGDFGGSSMHAASIAIKKPLFEGRGSIAQKHHRLDMSIIDN